MTKTGKLIIEIKKNNATAITSFNIKKMNINKFSNITIIIFGNGNEINDIITIITITIIIVFQNILKTMFRILIPNIKIEIFII